MKAIRVIALFTGIFLLHAQAIADVIRIEVKGTVSQIDPIFNGLVGYGDEMTAWFVYDTSTISQTIHFDADRAFHYTNSLHYEVQMGSVIVSGSGGRIESSNDYIDAEGRFLDRYIVEEGGVGTTRSDLFNVFDIANLTAGIVFYDYDEANALYSANQYLPVNFSLFDSAYVTIQMNLNDGVFDWLPMFAHVSELRVYTVNEPGTLALLSLGFVSIGFASRTRRKALEPLGAV